MDIVVCVKPVPDPDKYHLLTIDPATKRLVREGIPTVINPADKNALEMALQLRDAQGGTVTVVSMAPQFSQDKIRECLAMGVDAAFLLSDRVFGGADTYATSYTLARGIEAAGLKPDLVLCGNESADGATSHVAAQLGEWLGLPHIANIEMLELDGDTARVRKKVEGGSIDYEVGLPALFGVARGANAPRLVSAMGVIRSKNKPLRVLCAADIEHDPAMVGLEGSPTQAGELFAPDISRKAELIEGDAGEIARQILERVKQAGIAVQG